MNDEEFKSLLAKLRPVIGEMADAFWLGSILDPDRKADIHATAQALASEMLEESYTTRHILLEPPPQKDAEGEYPLGTVMYAGRPVCRFGLREGDLPQHVAILGRSGAGKTNVAYLLVWDLLRRHKPFIVLDWRGTYGHFLNRPEGKDILLFRPGDEESIGFNPLLPPPGLGLNQSEAYIRDIVSTIVTTYLPGHHLLSTRGVEYFFLKALEVLRACENKPATFNDVRDYMEHYHADSREMDWKVSALNVLFKLTTGPIGRLLNSECVTQIQDVLDKPVILELAGLGSETDRSLFTQAFLLWLYYLRLVEKSRSFRHAVIVEEAHNLFLRRSDSEHSVHDVMLRQMRELGEAFILLDQNPCLMSVPSLGNTGITICLNLKHGDDVEAAGKALTLPRENWNFVGRLPVGNAIVKLQDRWVRPFLVRFPQFPVAQSVQSPQPKSDSPKSDSAKRAIEELRYALNEAISALPLPDRRRGSGPEIGMNERMLLQDIAEYPLSVITERFRRLHLSPRNGTEAKRTLLEAGLIDQEKVSVPRGSVTLLKIIRKGKKWLAAEGIFVKTLPKNASLEHEYYRRIVAEDYRKKGYDVKEEVPIGGGKTVDLVASKDGRRIAIEIETGKSDAEGNVRKCREAGFDSVATVPTGKLRGHTTC
jgi:hypothetical protein